MALPSKGLRNIVVDNIKYQYNVKQSKPMKQREFFDHTCTENPLGVTISIQLADNPKSSCTYILGYEPQYEKIPSIKPPIIVQIIKTALLEGWEPLKAGNIYKRRLAKNILNSEQKEDQHTFSQQETTKFINEYNKERNLPYIKRTHRKNSK